MRTFTVLFALLVVAGCDANSSKNQFRLAEQLFNEKKYDASIHEFEKIVERDPLGDFGVKSLHRIGTIQHFYLDAPDQALKSYKLLLKRSAEKSINREVQSIIATLYFERFEDFGKAVEYYKMLFETDPTGSEADYFLYRLARSYYLMAKFVEAIQYFTELKNRFPSSVHAAKAELEIANSWGSRGKCREAIARYESIIKSGAPELKTMAIFEMANCYEVIDDLDKAYDLLSDIQDKYPNPNVISLKMQKIKRRKILRRR